MATRPLQLVIRHLRRAARGEEDQSDEQLLDAFRHRQDESAFEAILRRHGPMVLGVCRRVLGQQADAEDAFQVTFLVLASKASGLRPRAGLGAWLYGVAYHTALKARAQAMRRRAKEAEVRPMPQADASEDTWHEVGPILDEELGRLPARYREAIVLCDLQGQTRRDAARALGIADGTLSGRLTTARRMLAERLTRRGVVLSASGLASLLTTATVAARPPLTLVNTTLEAATILASGGTMSGVVSSSVSILFEEVMKSMLSKKLPLVLVALVLVAGVSAFAGLIPVAEAQQPLMRVMNRIAFAASDEPRELWKAAGVLKCHEDAVQCLAAGPDNVILSGGKEGHVYVWDAGAKKQLHTFQNMTGTPKSIHYAADATWVAFRFENGIALTFDDLMKDKKPRHIGPGFGSEEMVPLGVNSDATSWIIRDTRKKSVEIQHGLDLRAKVIGQLRKRVTCEGHTKEVRCSAFSPDDELLVTGGEDNTARVWDAETGKEKWVLKGHTGSVEVVAFAPDGKTLATTGKDGEVRLWEVKTGKELATLKPGAAKQRLAIRSIAFSPDGKLLASGGEDKLVRVWEVKTGTEQARLKGHTDSIAAVCFTRDGTLLVSGSADKTVRTWQPVK